jgi:protein-S-isoprenylcysteine O-methyltransferase Ste14
VAVPTASADTSGVRIFPPGVYGGAFFVAYLGHRLWPVRLWGAPAPAARVLGWSFVAAGVLLPLSAAVLFRRAGTTPNPTRPTTALVVRGPYRFTRNPMYLGLALLYVGGALLVNSLWPLVFLPGVLVVVQRQVIVREEAYLERTFGEAYRAYRARVRRWF